MTCPTCSADAVEMTVAGALERSFVCPKCRNEWVRPFGDDTDEQPIDAQILDFMDVPPECRSVMLDHPLWPAVRFFVQVLGSKGFFDEDKPCESGPVG